MGKKQPKESKKDSKKEQKKESKKDSKKSSKNGHLKDIPKDILNDLPEDLLKNLPNVEQNGADDLNNNEDVNVPKVYEFTAEDLEKCARVRKQFLELYDSNPEDFHVKDRSLVENDDWWTIRFIKLHRGNEEKALKEMITTFKWRKSFGVVDRTIDDLPQEFAKTAALFPLGKDYKGRNVMYVRVKVYRKIQQLNIFFQQFVTGVVDYVDVNSGPKGFVIVFDVTGMGFINVDFDFLQFLIQLLQHYYPCGMRYAVLHNVPRILRPLWSMAKLFLGSNSSIEKTYRFVSGDEIQQYIPKEELPIYLGGECDFDFTNFEIARNCLPVEEIAPRHGISPDEVAKFKKLFEPHFKEAALISKGVVK